MKQMEKETESEYVLIQKCICESVQIGILIRFWNQFIVENLFMNQSKI